MAELEEFRTPETDEIDIDDRVGQVSDALAESDSARVVGLVADLRTRDLADIIELLNADERIRLIETLGPNFDFEALSDIDEVVRDQLSEALPNELLAKAVTELETDDAAYLIESLEEEDQEEILAQIPNTDRAALKRNLDYPEETAGRLMQGDFVAVAPYWTIGQVIDHAREADDLPETFAQIYVVDPAFRVLGGIELSRLLRTKRDVSVQDIMDPDIHVVQASAEQEEAARQFERSGLLSAPVVDQARKLVGVLTIDDVVEVLESEADEDMRALGGVGDESLADTVLETARSRVPWLVVNLATAILASTVIQLFDATIEQMVALAVLMPIVASMGGNAGTQTMTVTVRALATHKLSRVNAPRVITREAVVGLVNGLVLSLITSALVFVWFGSGLLGGVIAGAMIVNLLFAAVAGILIPLALDKLDLDPAPASGVFVTTVTDCIGFFAFLGLAKLLLF